MIQLLLSNLSNIIIVAVLLAAVLFALRSVVKKRKSGGCGCGCSGCSGCSGCGTSRQMPSADKIKEPSGCCRTKAPR